jgi:hypothetical protein
MCYVKLFHHLSLSPLGKPEVRKGKHCRSENKLCDENDMKTTEPFNVIIINNNFLKIHK